jgi:hypothetical protein
MCIQIQNTIGSSLKSIEKISFLVEGFKNMFESDKFLRNLSRTVGTKIFCENENFCKNFGENEHFRENFCKNKHFRENFRKNENFSNFFRKKRKEIREKTKTKIFVSTIVVPLYSGSGVHVRDAHPATIVFLKQLTSY